MSLFNIDYSGKDKDKDKNKDTAPDNTQTTPTPNFPHCPENERDHTRIIMIYLFGGTVVFMLTFGLSTQQIKFTGSIDVSSAWQLISYLAVGVFTWIMKDSSDKRNSGNNNLNKPP